jgi:hypothetical protein
VRGSRSSGPCSLLLFHGGGAGVWQAYPTLLACLACPDHAVQTAAASQVRTHPSASLNYTLHSLHSSLHSGRV